MTPSNALATRLARPQPTFASSLLAILGGQAACGVLAFSAEVSYARLLGPAARGFLGLCVMSVALGTLVGGLGGEGTIVYFASRSGKTHSSWLPAVLAWGGLGCAVASVLWALAYWQFRLPFLRGISSASARVVLLSIPAAVLFAYTMALASGTEQFRLRSACAVLRQAVGLLSFFPFFLLLGRTTDTALWGNFAGLAVGSLAGLWLLRRNIAKVWRVAGALRNLKPTLSYGLRGQAGNLPTFFAYRLDVFIINYFLDPAQLGFYALGVVVSEALWQIPYAVASALFPRTARTLEQDASQFTCFVLRQILVITCLCGIAIAALSPFLIPLVFGARFKPAVPVIWWILPGTIALSLGKVACADLAGRGRIGYSSAFAFVCFVITVVLDLLLIPRMGIQGAALASSISYFADAVLALAALRYELRVSWTSLLVPTRTDFHAYRFSWLRLKSALTLAPASQAGVDVAFSSPQGD